MSSKPLVDDTEQGTDMDTEINDDVKTSMDSDSVNTEHELSQYVCPKLFPGIKMDTSDKKEVNESKFVDDTVEQLTESVDTNVIDKDCNTDLKCDDLVGVPTAEGKEVGETEEPDSNDKQCDKMVTSSICVETSSERNEDMVVDDTEQTSNVTQDYDIVETQSDQVTETQKDG